jgi:hypothetical protein
MLRSRVLAGLALLLAIVGALYAAAVGYLVLFQRDFVFHPGGALAAPAELGLQGIETVEIRAKDGTKLTGWYAAAAPDRPTVLYFAGNAGNISGRAEHFREIIGSGFGLLAVSYRGYPGSEGSPSEAAFFSDALEIYDWLAPAQPRDRAPRRIARHRGCDICRGGARRAGPHPRGAVHRDGGHRRRGISLGAGILPHARSVPVARAHPPGRGAGPDPARHRGPGHPGRPWPAPLRGGGEPKRLEIIEGAGHSDLWDRGLWTTVLAFLAEHP